MTHDRIASPAMESNAVKSLAKSGNRLRHVANGKCVDVSAARFRATGYS